MSTDAPPTSDAQPAPGAPPNPSPDLGGALAGAIRIVFSFTLLSRFFGLGREVLTARILGDTIYGSAFAAAFIVPNLFRRLFGEGALTAAFLPEYTRLIGSDREQSRKLASLVVGLLTLTTGLLTLVIEAALFAALSFRWTGADSILSVKLTMIMLPMMPMVCITAILGGMLQAHGRFGPPAAAPILLNLFMIAGCATHFLHQGQTQETTTYWIAWTALASSVAQIVWSLFALRGLIRWTRAWDGVRPAASLVLKRFGPVVVGLGALQLSTMADQLIAMWPIWIGPTMFGRPTPLDEASNGILSTTSRFYQFPLGVFGLAVATAVFPLLSRTASDKIAFADMLRRGLRISLLIGLPASAGLWLVAPHLTAVMLQGGKHAYTAEGLLRASAVLVGFAPAVWAYSLNNVLTRAFYALNDTRTPMRVSLLAVLINLVLNLALIFPLREAGLAWATALSGSAQFLVLATYLGKRHGVAPLDRPTTLACLKIILCTAGMVGALLALKPLLPAADTWTRHALALAAHVAVGAGAFGGLALALRLPELRWVARKAPPGGVGAYLTE